VNEQSKRIENFLCLYSLSFFFALKASTSGTQVKLKTHRHKNEDLDAKSKFIALKFKKWWISTFNRGGLFAET